MKKYHVIRDTPLVFHKFFWYFSLPVGLVLSLAYFFPPNFDISDTGLFGIIDILCMLADAVLKVMIFIGFFSWKSYAWYCVIILQIFQNVYRIYVLIIYILFLPSEVAGTIGELITYLSFSIFVCIYYIKRRPLFFSSAPLDLIQPGAEEKPAPIQRPAPTPPAKQKPPRRISAVTVVGIIGGIIAAVLIGAVVYDIGYRNGEKAAAEAYEVELAETREETNNDEYFTNPTIEPNQGLYLLSQEALASGEAMTMLINDGFSQLENLESSASHAYNIGFANDYYHGYFYGYTDGFYNAVQLYGVPSAAEAYVYQHDIIGAWRLHSAVAGGVEVPGDQMEAILGTVRFVFYADGTCTITMSNITGNGTWFADGNLIVYKSGDVEMTGYLDGDIFSTVIDGSNLIFTRE